MEDSAPGALYLVATPIGNLGDISERAAQTLRDVDFIAAEDTRVTRKLLEHLHIKKPLISYYEHNSLTSGEKILGRILVGENCALVTDAGTPGISDPGEHMVALCAKAGVTTTPIPGPCAAVAALSSSGLAAGRFAFEGFLSTARKSRFDRLNELKTEKRTMVFYEAPHKLLRTLKDMLSVLGDRKLTISREMTKVFEEILRLDLSQAILHFENTPPRGEFVLVIEGAKETPVNEDIFGDAVKSASALIDDGLSVKDAVKAVALQTGVAKNALYNAVMNQRR